MAEFKEIQVPGYANIFLASSSLDAIKVNENDRRWFELKNSKKEIRLNPDFDFKKFINNKTVEIKE